MRPVLRRHSFILSPML